LLPISLSVTDTLDDVLKLVKDKKKSVTKKVMVDSGSTSKTNKGGLFDLDDESAGSSSGVAAMGNDDIMKYITQNQPSSTDDDLDFL